MKAYRIGLTYECLVGIKSLNKMLRDCGLHGPHDGPGIIQEFTITANLLGIPNNEKREKLGKALIQDINNGKTDMEILSCHFKHFEDIQEIEV